MAIHEQDRAAIQAAVKTMGERPHLVYTIADLSHEAGMSTSRFTNVFRKVTGLSVQEQLATFRMEKAMYLLRETAQSISAIAKKVGFRSSSSFTRKFKKHTGTQPARYRLLNKG